MGELKLYGMRGANDETLATAIRRKHEPQHFVGHLLKAEISEKRPSAAQMRSVEAMGVSSRPAEHIYDNIVWVGEMEESCPDAWG
jgi:hypothetical protein